MNAIRHCFNNFKLETKLSANKIRHLKFEICFKKKFRNRFNNLIFGYYNRKY